MIGDVQSLTDAFATVFEAVKGPRRVVAMVHLANVSGSAVLVSVCECPTGVVADVGNAMIWEYSIPANDFFEFGEGVFVNVGNRIQAKCSVSGAANIKLSVK